MSKSREPETLQEVIAQINEVLNEITCQRKMLEENHKVNMRKFSKLLEYDKISDMTNQVFERRIASIEKLLYEVFKG